MRQILLTLFVMSSGCTLWSVANSETETTQWVCMKDEQELKIKGSIPKEKQKACAKQGGRWQELKQEPKEVTTEPAQKSGGGGGW